MTRKCVVWDLDETLWEGVCLEGEVRPRADVLAVIAELDRRGILHAIASRGELGVALPTLRRHGLEHWFVAIRVNGQPKPENLRSIAGELSLALDSFVFVDDDPFEREQVAWMMPEVLVLSASDAGDMCALDVLSPASITPEGSSRRAFYQANAARRGAERSYPTRAAFLAACDMRMQIHPFVEADRPRVLELMSRTHQLNSMGWAVPVEILDRDDVEVWVARLEDRFGDYGTIGVAILDGVTLRYLAVSCRVMGRGVEKALLARVLAHAARVGEGVPRALLRETERNRAMRVLFQMSGLVSARVLEDGTYVFQPHAALPSVPSWIRVSP